LTQPGVEKALKDFGLDAESASHQPLMSPPHGQKVNKSKGNSKSAKRARDKALAEAASQRQRELVQELERSRDEHVQELVETRQEAHELELEIAGCVFKSVTEGATLAEAIAGYDHVVAGIEEISNAAKSAMSTTA
jgi:hypothetical protein